jgi:hypothetical protein
VHRERCVGPLENDVELAIAARACLADALDQACARGFDLGIAQALDGVDEIVGANGRAVGVARGAQRERIGQPVGRNRLLFGERGQRVEEQMPDLDALALQLGRIEGADVERQIERERAAAAGCGRRGRRCARWGRRRCAAATDPRQNEEPPERENGGPILPYSGAVTRVGYRLVRR